MKKIGKLITEARRGAGLTQEAFAAKLGITPQAVSKWENDVGFPDVALLPDIASILGLSLDALFGVKEEQAQAFSDVFEGLPFICAFENTGCYSDKNGANVSADGKAVYFADGSEAHFANGLVINKGRGEIRFYEADAIRKKTDDRKFYTKITKNAFDSLNIHLAFPAEVKICSVEGREAHIEAEGDGEFIDALELIVDGGRLSLSAKTGRNYNGRSDNKLLLHLPFENGKELSLSVSGSADCEITPWFEMLSFSISGSGGIKAKGCDRLSAKIAGSGDLDLGIVKESGSISVSGSGDVVIGEGKDIYASVAGSGDINISKAVNSFEAKVAGSGDICAGGQLEKLKLDICGSGSFNGKELSVSEADICIMGSGDIVIDRIKRCSTERLSKNCSYKVNKRG